MYKYNVTHFALNNDGIDFDKRTAPLDNNFLDKTTEEVLNQDENAAEENTIILTVERAR